MTQHEPQEERREPCSLCHDTGLVYSPEEEDVTALTGREGIYSLCPICQFEVWMPHSTEIH